MEANDKNREKAEPWPDLDLDKIRSRQAEYFERHKSFLRRFDDIIDEYLRLFLDMSRLAFGFIKKKTDEEFMYAYVILGSRWFSHIESLICLFYSGYYGDVIALARMLTGDINLLMYFSHFPEDVPRWRKLATYGPPKKEDPPCIKKLRHYFLDGEVRKRLATKQQPFEGTGVLSEAVHATEWGSQFYSQKVYDAEHSYRVHFGPRYDPIHAVKIWGLLMAFIRPPTDVFLHHCQQFGLDIPGGKEIESKAEQLAYKYHLHLVRFTAIADIIEKIEARAESGEDFYKIIDEENKRFEERGYLESQD